MTQTKGALAVERSGRGWVDDSRSPSRREGTASVEEWTVRLAEAFTVTAGVWRWDHGEAHVGLVERQDAHERVDRLKRGLRMSINAGPGDGECWVEMGQARIKNARTGDSNVFRATMDELDEGAGASVARLLRRAGALRVGAREDVLGDSSRRRAMIAAVFPADAVEVAVLAYAAVRVIPLHRGVGS